VVLKTVGLGTSTIAQDAVLLKKLGSTKKTTFNSTDADPQRLKAGEQGMALTQNIAFADIAAATEDIVAREQNTYSSGERNYLDAGLLAGFSTANNGHASIAVVAVKGESRSPLKFNDIASWLAQIPISSASYAAEARDTAIRKKYGLGQYDVTDLRVFDATPITMADGHTALIPIVFDVDQAETVGPVIDLPYHMLNTSLKNKATYVIPEGKGWKKNVAAQQKKNYEGLSKGGGVNEYAYDKDVSWSKLKDPQTEMATVPYPVNGTSDFVKFLASNMMAGNSYLDITKYVGQDGAPDADDALSEAVDQNPYILYTSATISTASRDGKILAAINYSREIKDWSTQQKQLWEKVQSVDNDIIKSGMSNEEKAQAIDNYLAKNAKYDYPAFTMLQNLEATDRWFTGGSADYFTKYPNAGNATGILLKGTGVCASYASAFKALADQADLPCVYVTGTVNSSGNRHAWNKVALEGKKYLIVDSTWNDAGSSSSRKYFGLKDSDLETDRVQDSDFVVDAYIGAYAN
jgi:hypothetical protein